jgi:uncharacterized tellurite resistance protein B-like protein
MLDAIRTFFSELTGTAEARDFGEEDCRLAAAALLFHVVAVDGSVSDKERQTLSRLLAERFALDADGVAALVAAAEQADKEAVDLYGFTSVIKRRFEEADREKIVEMMWQLVYADGAVHEFEDNVIWRVAELLGVSSQVRMRLKRAARGSSSP